MTDDRHSLDITAGDLDLIVEATGQTFGQAFDDIGGVCDVFTIEYPRMMIWCEAHDAATSVSDRLRPVRSRRPRKPPLAISL